MSEATNERDMRQEKPALISLEAVGPKVMFETPALCHGERPDLNHTQPRRFEDFGEIGQKRANGAARSRLM
jgi:hypothetical protein